MPKPLSEFRKSMEAQGIEFGTPEYARRRNAYYRARNPSKYNETRRLWEKTRGPYRIKRFDENGLTRAQVNVLGFLLAGHRAPEIAKELKISEKGIRSHMHYIYRKLGASGREDLIAKMHGKYAPVRIEKREVVAPAVQVHDSFLPRGRAS
jgi:DNA-binding CsgD family transcriptional regulator